VAVADSLWWFDSKYEQHPVGPPGGPPSTIPISDSYTLVKPYGSWDDHDPQNVISFTNDLAKNYFGTNQVTPGTNIYSMYIGIQRYLRDHGLWDDYIVTLVNKPEFDWIAKEVMRSEDVILLLGFWQQLVPGGPWVRISGHYVAVAGVDLANFQLALSDPIKDNAEGGPGRVLNGQLIPHTP